MSLQLIIGSSGAGKSYQMYSDIITESLEHKEDSFIVIVPEQFTLQTQKEIVTMHPYHGTMNIDIVSFNRLAYRIFDELSFTPEAVLEDIGKSMVIRKIMEDKKGELTVFDGSINKPGFIEQVKSLLSEFYQYDMKKEKLEELLQTMNANSMLYHKLCDVNTIYEGFEEFLEGHFIAAEQVLDVLSQKIDESKKIRNSTICIDGFTGFTPIQYHLLAKLLKVAKKVVVTVTMDRRECGFRNIKDYELFALSKKTIYHLGEIAKEYEVTRLKDIILSGDVPYRFMKNKELACLEHNLFRYPYSAYEDEVTAISFHMARNPRGEAAFIGRRIRRLVRDGYRYRDIAVITGDLNCYEQEISEVFPKLQIPFFIDQNKSMMNNPCIESIRSILQVIEEDFSYESVFRYLKSGMTKLELDIIDELENYVIATGIRGYSGWSKKWNRNLRRLSDEKVEQINEWKNQFLDEVIELRQRLKQKKSKVKDWVEGIYNFMTQLSFESKMENMRVSFEEAGDLVSAKAYDQVYGAVIELFDKMVEILGDETLSLDEFRAILDVGLEETALGVIPPGLDQVVVGDIERTRLKDVKVLFLMGANDGIIPKASKNGGILTELERDTLSAKKIDLAPSAKENAYIEQFYLYLNLTKPDSELILSFSKVDLSGKSLRPSYLIGRLEKLFPKIQVIDEEKIENELYFVNTMDESLEYFVEGLQRYILGKDSEVFRELAWIIEKRNRGLLDQLLDGAYYSNTESPLNLAVTKALYGESMTNSVTRLEKYAACAFAHFMKYGLQLAERQEYTMRAMDVGNIFHKTVEVFSKRLEETPYNWRSIPEDERDRLVEECVLLAANEYSQDILDSSARNHYMLNVMKRIAKRTIWALQQHVKRGEFEPCAFELDFANYKKLKSSNISLDNNLSMRLTGKIDRIDRYEDEDSIYLKVIDYKSGNTVFDVVDLYYGLQIQLVVYMNAALEIEGQKLHEKNVIPAGVFYYNMKDPIIDKIEEDQVPSALLKELKMNGIVNSNSDVIDHMEKEDDDGFLTIPVSRLSKGGLSKLSKVASSKQLDDIGAYVSDKIKNLGNEIMGGNIDINPYLLKKKSACDYCEYHSICAFDTKAGGNAYRRFSDFDKEKIYEMIEKERNKEGE